MRKKWHDLWNFSHSEKSPSKKQVSIIQHTIYCLETIFMP